MTKKKENKPIKKFEFSKLIIVFETILVALVSWKVLAYEVGVPAYTRVDFLDGYALDCWKPSKLYDYFYVLSAEGDTLVNLTPMRDDVWAIEKVTEENHCGCLLEGERWVLYVRP